MMLVDLRDDLAFFVLMHVVGAFVLSGPGDFREDLQRPRLGWKALADNVPYPQFQSPHLVFRNRSAHLGKRHCKGLGTTIGVASNSTRPVSGLHVNVPLSLV